MKISVIAILYIISTLILVRVYLLGRIDGKPSLLVCGEGRLDSVLLPPHLLQLDPQLLQTLPDHALYSEGAGLMSTINDLPWPC